VRLRERAHAVIAPRVHREDRSRLKGCEEQRRGRRHAGREEHRLGVLEAPDGFLVARPGWIPVAEVRLRRGVRVPAQVVRSREDRAWQERLALLGRWQAGADDAGAGAVLGHGSRIAWAKSSGSNGLRSSSASPIPISFTGTPSSCAIARAIPPLAVPSSLVSTIPLTSTASRNRSAWRRPFWPVVASIVSSVSCGAPGAWRAITLRTLPSSSIRWCWVWRRPAVSTITTSWPRARAASIASKA